MKKLLSLGLTVVCLATLSGCENMTRAIRGNDYVDAKTAASSSAAQASASASSSKAYQKEVKKLFKQMHLLFLNYQQRLLKMKLKSSCIPLKVTLPLNSFQNMHHLPWKIS